MLDLILASTSPYRRALLERLQLPFRTVAPRVDESAWKGRGLKPDELARQLARAKAQDVAREFPAAWVIGSDQVAACAGALLDKPGDRPGAIAQLERLQGRTHSLTTAVCLVGPGKGGEHVARASLTMRALSRLEIERYVDRDQPFDCAGSYKLECLGIALFERIESDDFSAITGLPLLRLAQLLRETGCSIP